MSAFNRTGLAPQGPFEHPASSDRSHRAGLNGGAVLVAPAAVRIVNLDEPLVDLRLPPARLGGSYRSLVAIARLDGDPIGSAVIHLDREGRVARDRLALELRRQLVVELGSALARRGLDLPPSLTEGVPRLPGRRRPTARRRSVSVVVTTCRNPVALARGLRSILACEYDDLEVIVVENRPGPPDTRLMLAEEFGDDPRVRYVEEPARGLASARNAGLAVAEGELVAFTDDDVVVDSAWIRRSAEAFERRDEVACVTGLILPVELETETQLLLEQFMTLGKGFSRQTYRLPETLCEYPLLPYTPGVIGSGANTVLRADVAWQLGGFDASLGTGTPAAGGEDLDLYIRLLQEGHTVAYEPSAVVWHAHPDGMAKLRRQVYGYGVGLGATFSKQLVAGPDRQTLLRAVPAGIRYLRDPTSRKNAGKSAGYPRRLDWLERLGMLVGPAAYLASLLRPRRRRGSPLSSLTCVDGRVLNTERLGLPNGQTVKVVEVRPQPALGDQQARPPPPGRAAEPDSDRRRANGGEVAAPFAPVPGTGRQDRPSNKDVAELVAKLLARRERPTRREPAEAGTAERAALTGLFFLSLAMYATGRMVKVPTLGLGGELGVLFFGIGAAPLQFSRTVALSARLGVAGLLGLSTVLLIGAVMVLGPLWHPDLAAILVVAAACAAHAVALPSALADLRLALPRRSRSLRLPRAPITPSSGCTLVGTALWLGSAIFTGHIVPGIGGFPSRITPLWYVGVLLVLAGITLALREKRERNAAIAVGSLVLAFTLTPALLYDMPRSQSAAKHVECVHLILGSHHLRAGDGIYFAYSGLFSGVAWLCRLARFSDAIGLATFWPVVMGFIKLAELRFLFGVVIEGHQRRWAAITLVVLVDAIGADYFSPQSVGYVMGLGIFALALGAEPPVDRRLTAALMVISGCALAVTHELSPYIIGGVLLVLASFRCARPRWAGLAILVPAGLWALLNRHVLAGFLSLSSLGKISNFAPPNTTARPGLGQDPIVAQSSHALTLGLLVLIAGALVGHARHRRERWAWAYLASAGVGLLFVAVNPYGNEGIFRASLFGIPWLALLAAHAVRRPTPVLGAWMALSVGLLATFLVAAFGMDASGVMRRADLQALRIFEREASRRSYLLQVGFGDLPTGPPHIAPASHQIRFEDVNDPATQLPGRPRESDLPALSRRTEEFARDTIGTRTDQFYVIWSPVSSWYALEYGLESPGQTAKWRDLLLASPSWRVVYHRDGTYLFRTAAPSLRGGSGR
jgi:GT2 family glycosyltransferase